MALVDYALACGHVDGDGHQELLHTLSTTRHDGLLAVIADLPVPRWDLVPVTEPVDGPQRDFAVALLDIAGRFGPLVGADRKWRTIFAVNARTAADLLVLFLDIEPYLRRRNRKDPAMASRLERLAFVPTLLRARGRGRLSRAEFDSLVERAASGESLAALHAALDTPGAFEKLTAVPEDPPASVEKPTVVEDKPALSEEPIVVGEAKAAEPPAIDLDRARVAKYLEQALFEGRLDPGEHAARTVALWSATTSRQLAGLVVDLPVPAREPLRDRRRDPHSDNLIAPSDRQAVVDRLNQAMANHGLSLWEYETRLDVALNARDYHELRPAAEGLSG